MDTINQNPSSLIVYKDPSLYICNCIEQSIWDVVEYFLYELILHTSQEENTLNENTSIFLNEMFFIVQQQQFFESFDAKNKKKAHEHLLYIESIIHFLKTNKDQQLMHCCLCECYNNKHVFNAFKKEVLNPNYISTLSKKASILFDQIPKESMVKVLDKTIPFINRTQSYSIVRMINHQTFVEKKQPMEVPKQQETILKNTLGQRVIEFFLQNKGFLRWNIIQMSVEGNKSKLWYTLCMFVNEGLVEQIGKGKRNDPYFYKLASGFAMKDFKDLEKKN